VVQAVPAGVQRETQVRRVPTGLQLQEQPPLAHAHSHAREALRVQVLQPQLQPVFDAQEPPAAAHG
ncbi:hypothetical protein HPB47_016829, partial [Ixodes persulcatus]